MVQRSNSRGQTGTSRGLTGPEGIRNRFEEVKSQISEKTGRKKSLMDRLDEELGIKTVDALYERLDELEKEIEKRKTEKEKLLTKVDKLLSGVEVI